MSDLPLVGVEACVFDAYGTLFDFAAAARGCRDVLGDSIDKVTALWRDKQLQYTWLRALQGQHADFWQVTSDALDFALETMAIKRPGLRDRLMTIAGSWFPTTHPGSLNEPRRRGDRVSWRMSARDRFGGKAGLLVPIRRANWWVHVGN